MTAYGWAWLAAAASVLVGLLALWRATRGLPLGRTRPLLAALIAVWLLLPAPVPGYSGHYAPAFLVFLFEWWFQAPGQPRPAGFILLAGGLLVAAAALLLGMRRRRRGNRGT